MIETTSNDAPTKETVNNFFASNGQHIIPVETKKEEKPNNKHKLVQKNNEPSQYISREMNYDIIETMLETEKQQNKTEAWNKLDKTIKKQKLNTFADTYSKEHGLPLKENKALKLFFLDCLEKNKLQKAKDVVYNKDSREITSIPALFFNNTTNNYTLRNMDIKRVSTLKSLTPKRASEKSRVQEDDTAPTQQKN
jgi:hypothetical protein